MKKISTSILLMSIFFVLQAQVKKTLPIAKTPIADALTKATCDCFTKESANVKNMDDLQKIVGVCMMKNIGTKTAALFAELKIKTMNEAGGRKMGEIIGGKLAAECPAFAAKAMDLQMAKEGDSKTDETVAGPMFQNVEILKIETAGNTFVTIKDSTGKTTKLLWFEYFKGSDNFKENPQTLVGKKVNIHWKQIDMYDAKAKDYVTVKEITALELD